MGRGETEITGRLEKSSLMGRLIGAGMAITIGARGMAVVVITIRVLLVTGVLTVVDCPLELSGLRRDITRRWVVAVVVGFSVVVVVVDVVVVVVVISGKADSVST